MKTNLNQQKNRKPENKKAVQMDLHDTYEPSREAYGKQYKNKKQ